MSLLYHAYVYLEFLILACTIYILAPELTVKEYDILCLLAANKGRVLTYEQIYDKVWGEISAGNEKDTVGFHIRNLRKKLCDTNSHFSIDSVREIGYRFNSQ